MLENPDNQQTPATDGWLGLLARDASLEELRAYRHQLLSQATTEAERERIEQEAEQAAGVQQRLLERREHAAELLVLNDLARRLASLHEERDLLQEVASQARRLLSADVAYLMLHQKSEDGSERLRIEVSDGSLGSVLAGTELDLGEGLGGLVMRDGKPVRTANYLEDTSIPHLPHVDQVALSEHLGGILAVPLNVGGETLGVLLASNRRTRNFTDREIELLAALAAHASVAIRNSQLYEQRQRSEAGLRAALDDLQEANITRQKAFDLRERLTQSVIRGGTPAEILAEMRSAVHVPIRFEDADNAEFAELFADSTSDAPILTTHNGMHRVAVPVLLATGYGGVVVADSEEPLDDEALRMLPLGATSIAILVASQRSLAEMELRNRSDFMTTLLGTTSGEAEVRRHGSAVGIDVDSVNVVLASPVGVGLSKAESSRRLLMRVAKHFHGWTGQYSDHLVVLLPHADIHEIKNYASEIAGEQLPGPLGLANVTAGVASLRDGVRAAIQTATMLSALGRHQDLAVDSELGIYRTIFSQAGRNEISAFVKQSIGALLDYDTQRKANLASTLSTYLENSQHHAKTCTALHIHANTLYNRLERIDQLLGPGWKDSARCLDIQLALRMSSLMQVTLLDSTLRDL